MILFLASLHPYSKEFLAGMRIVDATNNTKNITFANKIAPYWMQYFQRTNNNNLR